MRPAGLLWCLCALCGCAIVPEARPQARPPEELEYPGWFDIGAGYGVAFDTRSGDNDDASGVFVAFKGYPFQRWYSTEKGEKKFEERIKPEILSLLQGEVDEATADPTFAWGAAPTLLEINGNKKSESRKLEAEERELILRLKGIAWGGKGTDLPDTVRVAIEGKDPTEQALNDLYAAKYVCANDGEEWTQWFRRFAVFAGVSAGNFDGGGLDSTLFAVGGSYDITPELALLVGLAFYDVEEGGVTDTDSGFFFAFSLNLNAFRKLIAEATSVGG